MKKQDTKNYSPYSTYACPYRIGCTDRKSLNCFGK